MKVRDIISVIEEFAPADIQEKWDNSGLCIGSPDDDVTSLLIGFDCTPELVDEAVSVGADMILTHHPLIFNPLRRISPDNAVGLAVIKAIRAGIAVYAAHTSADKVLSGVSGAMAVRLGLQNTGVLEEEAPGIGLGVVGDLPSPMDALSFISLVKERFSLSSVRCSAPLKGMVSRVAMCGGSGSSLISKAMESGAQAYLCGDVSYHNFFTPEGFMIVDMGHYESEIEIVDILFSLIRKKIPTFAVRISENLKQSNPVYYY